ncbi:MAG: hypothetical protein EZS28_006257 [Streblomastix strix]|uniref:Uncharacterized protein n=1 Tax=Streblomastix strix TaxID=222440 RepID=A0A5J4WTC9_9EUKA|nr:MAG: hypothetical protein EZS28_006257 [Streblomastix strix]
MKKVFLDESTPDSIKESIAYSLSEWEYINSAKDKCFIPILNLLFDNLKKEEERLQIHPYDQSNEIRRNKYGLITLEDIIEALYIYSIGSNYQQDEMFKRRCIQLGQKYLNHLSVKVRIAASCLFGLASDITLGYEYRMNNDCLTIINDSLPAQQFKVVQQSFQSNISRVNHLLYLHQCLVVGTGLCLNCDLKLSSNPTQDAAICLEYRFIRNQLCIIRDLLKADVHTAKILRLRMNE